MKNVDIDKFENKLDDKLDDKSSITLVSEYPQLDYNIDPLKILNESISCTIKKDVSLDESFCCAYINYNIFVSFPNTFSRIAFKVHEVPNNSFFNKGIQLKIRKCFEENNNEKNKHIVGYITEDKFDICSQKSTFTVKWGYTQETIVYIYYYVRRCSPYIQILDKDLNINYKISLLKRQRCPNKSIFEIIKNDRETDESSCQIKLTEGNIGNEIKVDFPCNSDCYSKLGLIVSTIILEMNL